MGEFSLIHWLIVLVVIGGIIFAIRALGRKGSSPTPSKSLSEELSSLQSLHESGKLTDQEFADAKAATLRKHQETPTAPATSGSSVRPRTVILLAILLLLIGVIWYNAGTKGTSQLLATAVHAPITIKDGVENLPASSFNAMPLHLPYSGTLNVDIQVVRGNPIDVFVIPLDQIDTVKSERWNQMRTLTNFNALKTRVYRRDARLQEGDYYLVLRDLTMGILSASASDVSVKVQLNP